MKLSIQMVAVLTSVGLLSGGFLAGVGILTKERIELNKQKEIEAAVFEVVPGAHSSQKLFEEKDLSVYGGKDEQGNLVGLAIQASGVGFQDKIVFMLGTNTAVTKINSLVILEQKETPGLGAKITDRDAFLRFWNNKDCTAPLALHKPAAKSADQLQPSEVNAITGATISSMAVLDIANGAVGRVRQLQEEGRLTIEGANAR